MTVELSTPTASESRVAPRFEPGAGDLLQAQVQVAGQMEACDASVLDISRGGAKISVTQSLEVDAEALVTLQADVRDISRRARICWKRPTREGWLVGVAFHEELDNEQFDALAMNGFIERRRDTRIQHSADLIARWELESVPVPVRLLDLSTGGFKIHSPEQAELGKRVLVATEEHPGSPILGKVRWQMPSADGYDIGCAFIDKHGCRDLMRQLQIDHSEAPVEIVSGRSTRRLLGLALGVTTAALFGCLLTLTTQVVLELMDIYQ